MEQRTNSFKDIVNAPLKLCIGLMVLLVTIGAGGCPRSDQPGETPIQKGIAFASPGGPYSTNQEVGDEEVVDVPVALSLLPGEQPGQSVVVRLMQDGVDVAPTQTANLPIASSKTYLTFRVTVREGKSDFLAERGRGPTGVGTNDQELRAVITHIVRKNLVKVTLIPATPTIPRGSSQTFTMGVLPRGNTSGPVTVSLETDSPSLVPTPNTFNLTMVAGSTTPVERTVVLDVAGNAGLGSYHLFADQHLTIAGQAAKVICGLIPLRIIDGAGSPEFTFAISKTNFVVANGVPTEDVVFTLRSVNGFDGDVSVSHSSVSETLVEPNINPYRVRVTPATPVTFVRRLYRFFGTTPVTIIFRANSDGFTRKEITTTLTLP